MLPLVHVVLKWPEDSGRPAYMGGVSPVLYRTFYRHDLSKYLRSVQISAGTYFRHFLGKSQKSISASKCPITAPKICTWSLLLSKFSYHTHKLPNLRSAVAASLDIKKFHRNDTIMMIYRLQTHMSLQTKLEGKYGTALRASNILLLFFIKHVHLKSGLQSWTPP